MPSSVPSRAGGEDGRTTVLIVDDDLEFASVAADLLRDRGYRVVGHVRTAGEAAAACTRLDPDAVLLDVQLPDGNGVVLADRLRAAGARPSILLTSNDRLAVAPELARRRGARGFVPKAELARSDLDAFLQP